MKNLMIAIAFFFVALNNSAANSLPQNTMTPQYESLENAAKPRVKITIKYDDGLTITITISFRMAGGGNDNFVGEMEAVDKATPKLTQKVAMQDFHFTSNSRNASILKDATDITIENIESNRGENPTGLKVGDKLVTTAQGFSTVKAHYDLKANKK